MTADDQRSTVENRVENGNRPNVRTRTIVYVDGFNLYFGMREATGHRDLWLNVFNVAHELAQERELVGVKYFTADVSGKGPNAGKAQRQRIYLAALQEACPDLQILKGKYQVSRRRCRQCLHEWNHSEEKMTDVRIGVEIVRDAFLDRFDLAIVVSADSDLIPAVEAVQKDFGRRQNVRPRKGIIVAFPPKRQSAALKKVADAAFDISTSILRDNQLPPVVQRGQRTDLRRPEKWN